LAKSECAFISSTESSESREFAKQQQAEEWIDGKPKIFHRLIKNPFAASVVVSSASRAGR
jgi:hypothetical protein